MGSNSRYPLQHWTHEGGTASPLIINWPAGISESARGGIRHTPGHFVDILPTLLELAGVTLTDRPAGAPPFPGRSLVPAFEDDVRIERDFIFFAHTIQHRDAPGEHRALRVGDWKIVSRVEQDHRWKLYNLACDRNDLAAHQPERVRRMSELWHELNARYERQATRR